MTDTQNVLRGLPPVHALLEREEAQTLGQTYSRHAVRESVRAQLDEARRQIQQGTAGAFSQERFFDDVRRHLEVQDRTRLQRVLNATGIVIHTNMGRAPLAEIAVEAVCEVARGYSNLEIDLETGKRGGRGGQAAPLLCKLTGAEAAVVVNNNAAAVLLALSAVAQGGEVIISRGELVEIGGAFRVPDVIRQSGAKLVEVGTTNKTRLSDYADAITPETKMLLKVHASNYRIVGFHSEVSASELAALGRERGLPVMEDLGSGALIDLTRWGLPHEPTVAETVRAGIDVVAFSGDKLLGGPQCGLLIGKEDALSRMARHPLFRALRADKMTLAALEATLRLYEDGDRLREELPVLRMLAQTPGELRRRAQRLRGALAKLPGLAVQIVDGVGYSGGGTLPEMALPSQHIRVRPAELTVERLAERLRQGRPALVGMLADNAFILDVRTLADTDLPEVAQAFRRALPG